MVRITKEVAEKRMGDVSLESAFWCHNGSVLTNLQSLKEAFVCMADEDYSYHSNTERNDFSNWVKDVLRDDKLARDIAESSDRNRAAKCVAERMAFLARKL
ncbi:MAG: hypothetical protein U9N44_00765 [Chloroflexota bacterium]|nr:hypothetical protein [Chloroflexota bacterium]